MRKVFVLILSLCTFGSLALAAPATDPMKDPKMQEMMKKYEAAGKPGPEHKRLADLVGTWKTSLQMWHSPDAKPETSKGSATFKMILGGRWLQQEFKGMAMGQNFTGMGLLGYDNVKNKYESVWFDSMSTSMMKAEGTYDETSKTLKDQGTMSSPVAADKTDEFRTEWQILGKNKMVFSLYGTSPAGGPEYKMMEITYTK